MHTSIRSAITVPLSSGFFQLEAERAWHGAPSFHYDPFFNAVAVSA